MKMRRSRQRKGKSGSKQVGTLNVSRASSGPRYEVFTIPTPRGYLSKGASESNMETSLTDRKRPASNPEHVGAPTSFGTPQHVVVGQCYSDCSHDSQRSLDGDVCSARPGVKHIMVRLSGLIPSLSPATTSEVPFSINCGGRTKIMGTESEPNQQMFTAMQSNTISETQKHDRAGAAVCRDETGGSIANLPLLDKSCCALDSSNAQARSGFVQIDPISRPTNSNWLYPAVFPMNYRPVNGCHGCGATRFAPPCIFQRDFPRVVHYYAEHPTLSQKSLQRNRVEPPACCEGLDFEGLSSESIYAPTMEQDEGHVYGAQYINRDDVLMCPAPWVYEGRFFPGTPAMGVNWVSDCISEGQPRQSSSEKLEESYSHKIPDPVYLSAHCNTCSTDYSPDLDVDTQRHLEEKIGHEILLLSQKLANLQAQCGTRRPVHSNTKPAVLNRPQAPPLDVNMRRTQRDPKSASSRTSSISRSIRCQGTTQPRSGASSSSRTTRKQAAESRFKIEDRLLEGGRIKGANSSTPAQSSSRGSDSGASSSTATFNVDKNQPHSRDGSGGHSSENSTTGPRGSAMHCGVHQHGANEAVDSVQGRVQNFREDGEDGASNKARSFSRAYMKCVRGRGAAGIHLEECSYSDDMKVNLRIGGMNVQGHPNGSKQFDWEKFRFQGTAGLRGNEEFVEAIDSRILPKLNSQVGFAEVHAETWLSNGGTSISVSKSAQPGEGNSPAELAWTSTDGNDKQECENRGKRLPDRRIENRHATSGMRDADSPKEICGLDSRTAHHLLKAGLRRKPYFWKTPRLGPVPRILRLKKKTFGTRSPRKDCGKRLRRRTLFDLNLNLKTNLMSAGAALEEGDDENSDSGSQPWQLMEEETGGSEETVDAQCQREVADYKAEYATFVENTAVRLHKNSENEDYTSIINLQALTSGARSKVNELKLSEAPLVWLSKPSSQPAKKTYIKCVELVMAMKKKNRLCKLNGRKAFGDGYSYRRMDCLVGSKDNDGMEKELHNRADGNGGGASHNTEGANEDQVIREPVEPPETCCWDTVNRRDVKFSGFQNFPSATTLAEAREMKLFEDSLLQSAEQEEAHSLAIKGHSENTYNLAFMTNLHCDEGIPPPSNPESSIVDQVSSLASVLSRVMPKQMDSMEAEQLRARWEELIDALEKERLGLPKIKTGGRKIGVTTRTNSPRDSGSVKRIAEQMKSFGATTLNLEKEGVSIIQKEKDGLEDVGISKERAHWNKVEQKQAVVF
ncbi:uncharacterized protein [Physcomitrium patens]|uniref:uncharacterized protein isoform X3 n=1 Tax=Physcomitrium patens TaxID=3218 RepID=UPI000D1689A8|nr:uncharacterized protein LOC112276455 isoform X3 [Physcomitrium patens]|eukprot:XP_024363562.1 uncharacterized protein LOC112276455 isoform X3 [Physcomitrella patens]